MHSLQGHKRAWDMEARNRRVTVEGLESLHVVRACLWDRFFLSCNIYHLLRVKPNNLLSGLLSCNWLRVLQLALTFCSLCSNALPQGTLPFLSYGHCMMSTTAPQLATTPIPVQLSAPEF